jgi:hypothetical protein
MACKGSDRSRAPAHTPATSWRYNNGQSSTAVLGTARLG